MENKSAYFYFTFIILILLAGLIALSFINHQKNTKKIQYFNENIKTLDIAYNSSLNKYNLLTKFILEEILEKEKNLWLLEKAINSKGNTQRLYKGLLYKELYPIYKKLKKEGIRQFHFHTSDNKSFLRFHKPNKFGDDLSSFRESVKITNKENRAITNFETGRIVSGFRNVFPINYNNKHLGSVEISISTKMMVDSISNLDSRREYSFILNKAVVFPKLFETQKYLYQETDINPNFVIEDKHSSLPDSPKSLSKTANRINKKLSSNKNLLKAMERGDNYSNFVDIDDTYYDVTFIPMIGLNKKVEGYLIGYKISENLPFIILFEKYLYLMITSGMIIFILMIIIIQRKTETLETQKKWFKSITDNLGEGLYVMDKNAKINYVNSMACKILGYKEKDLLGENAHLLFHSHTHNNNLSQEMCPIFKGVLEKKYFSSSEEFFLTSSKKNIPVTINSSLIESDKDEFGIVSSFFDISSKKRLEEDSLLLKKALEASINCIIITDINAKVQWANPAFENLTGYKIYEIIGKDPKEFISSGKQDKIFYAKMWDTILSKKSWKGEVINKKKDGSLYNEELIITPVLDEKNEITNFIAIKQDISHKKIEAMKKEEKDKLYYQQSKMAAMGEMLGNIAHQWRQPLSTISTASTGIKLQKELGILNDENFFMAMDNINQSAQYLSQTIETFRGFFDSRNSIVSEFEIKNTILKSLNLSSSQFVSKDIKIIEDIENFSIISSENELIQIILNLLNNAKDKILKDNEKERFIFISTFKDKNKAYIEILDNGGGIEENIISRIFEPYFTTKHQSQGTGIGLYMCQDIVTNRLSGELNVKNEIFKHEGVSYKGAKFTIIIPLNKK